MLVLVQWALAHPQDWVELDVTDKGAGSRAWRNLPTKPEPAPGQLGGLDDVPGWLYDVNVQGVQMGGHDHTAIVPTASGLTLTNWNDDPIDWPAGTRWAEVWEFLPPAPDPRFRGRPNTRQTLTRYLEPGAPSGLFRPGETTGGPIVIRTWAEFVPPASAVTRHGVWLTDELAAAHEEARTVQGWDRWL